MFLDIAKALIPPQDDDPTVTIFRWLMWASVLSLMAVCSWLVFNMATAGELKELKSQVSEQQRTNLEKQIFDQQIQVCKSVGSLRTAHAQELSRLIRLWQDEVRNYSAAPPTLRSCGDLGISAGSE